MKKAMMFLLAMGAFNGVSATNTSQNLIVNGNFAENECRNDYCIFSGSNSVKGWTPDPEIQIGYGKVYNDCLGNERVLELAPNYNSCVRQSIKNLQAGDYQLKFQWGARKGRAFSDCQFAVSFNGNKLKTITPNDNQIHTETIDIKVKSGCEGEIRFCGVGGDKNSYGAILKSVSLVKKSDSVVTPPVVNPQPNYPQPTLPPVVNPQTPPGLYLDSHSGQCFQKQYQLQGGQVEIAFDYKVLSNTLVTDSAIYVTIDGQPIYRVLPCDSGKTIRLQGNIPKGAHSLGFCAVGCQSEANHQALISNIVIFQKQCAAGWGNDLIVNGNFQQNDCKTDWCIWNQQTVGTSIAGWIPSPEIEIGKGTVYNKAFGSDWVAQLDANKNTCIKQKVSLKPGNYQLNFDWAGRSGQRSSTNPFEVKVNGEVIKCIKPTSCDVHRESIEFTLQSCPQDSWIEFCGTGNNDSYGALIDNVKLTAFDQCASFKVVQY